jgi:hypothetical protein
VAALYNVTIIRAAMARRKDDPVFRKDAYEEVFEGSADFVPDPRGAGSCFFADRQPLPGE